MSAREATLTVGSQKRNWMPNVPETGTVAFSGRLPELRSKFVADAVICTIESTQRGVTDPAYEPGPYTEAESNVDFFVSWYVARMREELAR